MPTRALPIGAITDEFSPDLDIALTAMAELDMTQVELRMVAGRNIMDVSDDELRSMRANVEGRGMRILSIASPLLKCVLPGAPPVDPALQQDVFAARYTFDDQPRLAERAFHIATLTGARMIRVFSYWRSIDTEPCFEPVVSALAGLADEAARRGLVIGLENEHACNIATGVETARVLKAIDNPALGVIWDPANAFVSGETPFPDGYRALPVDRIVHVHAKDCTVANHKPTWGVLGTMGIDWTGQIAALIADGYRNAINLETHWAGPNGNKFEGSQICGRALRDLVRR